MLAGSHDIDRSLRLQQREFEMEKEIIVSRSFEETRVAIMENGMLVDLFIERKEYEKNN